MDVSLRDVLESDLPIFFEHQRDPIACRMAAFKSRDEPEFMAHWRTKILAEDAVSKKTILVDGRVVGNIVSFGPSGRREIGYWVSRDRWGKGIASEALARFLRLETERPLYAVVAKHNLASVRVLEKCGFAIERQRRGSPGARGPAVDELVMKLVAGEGPARR